jgi:hypothetical protein
MPLIYISSTSSASGLAPAPGSFDNYAAFSAAVAACNRAGGGRVIVPAGDWFAWASAAHADLVFNGGFEEGCFCGWTLNDPSGNSGVSIGDPHSGTYAAFLGAKGAAGTLSQQLESPAGTYAVSFFLATDPATAQVFKATLGATTVFSQTNFRLTPSYAYTGFEIDMMLRQTTRY